MTLLSAYVSSLGNPCDALLDALTRTMALRDGAMSEHGLRVRRYALAIAMEAGITDEQTIEALDAASLLHDVGKLGIPDQVLHKPGPLTAEEYSLVKRHATIGADILSSIPFPGPLATIVRHHHENWNGTGYPDRLAGEDIPVGARVLAVADCYDALTSDRPYRRALSHACAIGMIAQGRGTSYDPSITDVFLRLVPFLLPARHRNPSALSKIEPQAGWMPQARAV